MGKETTAKHQPQKADPEYLFVAIRREGAMRLRVAWGRLSQGGGVHIEKTEESGNIALALARLRVQVVLWIRKGLEKHR